LPESSFGVKTGKSRLITHNGRFFVQTVLSEEQENGD